MESMHLISRWSFYKWTLGDVRLYYIVSYIIYAVAMSTCMFYYWTFATFAGYVLHCHRVLIAMCKMIGFQDMHCKVEGSTKNTKSVAKAFMEAVTS